jgi:hypothetical protein
MALLRSNRKYARELAGSGFLKGTAGMLKSTRWIVSDFVRAMNEANRVKLAWVSGWKVPAELCLISSGHWMRLTECQDVACLAGCNLKYFDSAETHDGLINSTLHAHRFLIRHNQLDLFSSIDPRSIQLQYWCTVHCVACTSSISVGSLISFHRNDWRFMVKSGCHWFWLPVKALLVGTSANVCEIMWCLKRNRVQFAKTSKSLGSVQFHESCQLWIEGIRLDSYRSLPIQKYTHKWFNKSCFSSWHTSAGRLTGPYLEGGCTPPLYAPQGKSHPKNAKYFITILTKSLCGMAKLLFYHYIIYPKCAFCGYVLQLLRWRENTSESI